MYFKNLIILVFSLAILSLSGSGINTAFAATTANCFQFSRNLSVGATGQDVLELQKLLNQNPVSLLATTGIGAKGMETVYFGNKTKLAVIKFQEFYRSEVLTPAKLLNGTGHVGILTRTKLSNTCMTATAPSVSPALPATSTPPAPLPAMTTTSMATSTSGTKSSQLAILPVGTSISSFKSDTPILIASDFAPRGATVTLSALGLTPSDNIVHLDTFVISKTITNEAGVVFVVPADAPRGRHAIWISDSKGETNKRYFIVTDPTIDGPKVLNFTPKEGFLGTKVTVVGTGFLPQGNDIHISYGVIENVPSPDGKTLEFTVTPPMPGLHVGEDRPEVDLKFEQWFSVVNDNGWSESSIFYLKI